MTEASVLSFADWAGGVFCATRCYACMYGECPGEPHTWGSPEDFAVQRDWTVERHPAAWDLHQKVAGFIRNQKMADLGADACIQCRWVTPPGRGT